jgi:hypothetical protein
MRTCVRCRSILHPDVEEPPGRLTVEQDGDRRDYWLCSGCLAVIESQLNHRGRLLPFDPPLRVVSRGKPA